MKRLSTAVLALSIVVAAPVAACDGYVSIERAQTAELMGRLRDDAVDPLDQFFAFETLMCSDQPGIRDLTLRTAMASSNATIRGQVLVQAIMEKEVIAIQLEEVEGLAKEQYDRIRKQPTEMLQVVFRDPTNACLSFENRGACRPHAQLDVLGTSVTVNYDYSGKAVQGVFALVEGELAGNVTLQKEYTYPATIPLF